MEAKIEKKIDKLGRVVLPIDFRKAMGFEPSSYVSISMSGSVISIESAIRRCKVCQSEINIDAELEICVDCINKIKKLK